MHGFGTSEKHEKWLPTIGGSRDRSWGGPWERGRREGKPLSISFMYISDNLNAEASRRMTAGAFSGGRFRQYKLREEERSLRRGGRRVMRGSRVG